jgi:hypothetical protein
MAPRAGRIERQGCGGRQVTPAHERIRVMLADDHQMVRESLRWYSRAADVKLSARPQRARNFWRSRPKFVPP